MPSSKLVRLLCTQKQTFGWFVWMSAAAKAKRAETERKAIAQAQKIVAIWNARQAGGRALWF